MTRWMFSMLVAAASLLAGCVSPSPSEPGSTGTVIGAPRAPQDGQGELNSSGAVFPGQSTGEPQPLPDTRPPLSPNLPKNIESSGAAAPVVSLVKAARASLAAGRPDQAGASLERAMRIEPRNPWIWQALSALHIVTQQGEQAESEAKKAISLGKRNPYLDVENWRLIAEARKLKGDAAGASEALNKREDLQRLIAP